MKKRFLSVLLSLCLCLTLLPTAALADTTPTGTALTQDNISSNMTLSDGEYYLGDNITLTDSLTVTGTVTLDLNGKTLSGKNGSDATDGAEDGGNGGNAIIVNGGSLIVNGGTITGGNGGAGGSSGGRNGSGGTAIIVNSGSLTVNGGTITGGNSGSNGGSGDGGAAITVNGGSLTVNGGTITGGNGGGSNGFGGYGGSGGSGLLIESGTVTVGGSGAIKGGNGGNGGNGLRIEGGAVSVGGSGTIEGGDGGNSGSDRYSNGADGKTISTSGTGSIGVSSEAALKTAVEAGASSIKLTDDITCESTLICKDVTLTLDLNGHVLSFANSKKLQLEETTAEPNTTVTLIDSDPTATHTDSTLPKGGVINGDVLLTRGSSTDKGPVTLHANGGTVTGKVTLCMTGVIDCTNGTPTAFTGPVEDRDANNKSAGSLQGGIFYGELKEQYLTQPSANVKGKTITFMNDNARHAFEVVKEDGTAVAPTEPTASDDDHVFGGWYEKEDGAFKDTAFDFTNTTITSNLTLYAKWLRVIKPEHVTVYIDGVEQTDKANATVTYNGKPHTASVVIKVDGDTLVKDRDYTLTGNIAETGVGNYEFSISGMGNYDPNSGWTGGWKIVAAPVTGGSSSAPTYSVTAPTAAHGTVKSDRRTAEAGETVTLTVIPDAGYTLETLTVLDKNGKEIALTDLGNGKYSFKMPAGKVTVNATFMDDNTMLNFFVDVPADAYYYDAVLWAAKNGITGGVDENHFGPGLSCTRAQLAAFLYRYAQSQGEGFTGAWMFRLPFGDVSDWCYEAVAWCYMNNIVGGYGDGTFGTNDTVTRQQMVTILYRFAQAMGMDISVGEDTNILSYNDAFDVSEYAVEAFQWATGAGIVQGNDGNLMPQNPCTRAQIVTMLYRLLGE